METPAKVNHPGMFQPGNKMSVKSGRHSADLIRQRAAMIHADLLAVAPHLDNDLFIPAVQRYLDAAATESLLMDYINLLRDKTGKIPAQVMAELTSARRLSDSLARDLGLTPMGFAKIKALSRGEEAQRGVVDLISAGGRLRRLKGKEDRGKTNAS